MFLLLTVCGAGATGLVKTILLTALKSVRGDDICAVGYIPVKTLVGLAVTQCAFECMQLPRTKCLAVDYFTNGSVCDLIDNDQTPYVLKSGCKYYTVSVFNGYNIRKM
jgi:hypothetical protein